MPLSLSRENGVGATETGQVWASAVDTPPLRLSLPSNDFAVVGPNLLTNPSFDTDLSGWTVGANWAWNAAGAAKHTAGSTAALSQAVTLVAGETYRINWTMSGRTAGSVTFALGANVTGGITSVSSSTSLAAPAASTTFTITPTTDFDGLIEVTGVNLLNPTVASIATDGSGSSLGELRMIGTHVGIGYQAAATVAGNANNTAIGYRALRRNGIGGNNTAIGGLALTAMASGANNTAIGNSALASFLFGSNNTAIGNSALTACTTGATNTAIGTSALGACTTGASNLACGYLALGGVTTGSTNVAIGFAAGQYVTTPISNVLIGYHAGDSSYGATNALTTGGANVFIGDGTGFNSATQRNYSVAIGATAKVDGDYAVAIGRSAIAGAVGAVAIGVDSTGLGASTVTTNEIRFGTANHTTNIPGALRVGGNVGFYGGTPVARPTSTTDLRQALIDLGLYTTGGATPLNLNGGTLTAAVAAIGTTPAAAGAIRLANNANISWRDSGNTADIAAVNVDASTNLNLVAGSNGFLKVNATSVLRWSTTQLIVSAGVNLSLDNVTGTKFGVNSLQKMGWWNATPVVQNTGWAITPGYTVLRAFDPTTATPAEALRALGTLIDTLKTYGLLG